MATMAQIDLQQWNVLSAFPMPLTFCPSTPLNDGDLIALAERNQSYQIERNATGELEVTMSPGTRGGYREAFVIAQLFQWADVHGGVTVSSDGGFNLQDGSMRKPDASWVSDEKWNSLSQVDQERYAPVSPDFVIEILSRTDSPEVLGAKMRQWIANGARLAWMIDPFSAAVSVYRQGVEVEVLERPEVVEAGEPVAGFRLEMAKLWDR